MRRILCLAVAAAVTAACSAVQAADEVRYISTTGSNANPCTLARPCRSLQRAIGVTPAGGDIHILDSGFYGNNATIRKSLTISSNGNTVFLGASIIIDQADAVVALRGLTLDGRGTIFDGIRISAAAAVHIERCTIQAFASNGIEVSATGAQAFIVDTRSRDNKGHGALVEGSPRVTVDTSHFENNGFTGMRVLGGNVTINSSTASGNAVSGVEVIDAATTIISTVAAQNGLAARNGGAGFVAAQGSSMTVESSVAHGNHTSGVLVNGQGVARISNSIFTGNEFGIRNLGGTLETRGNNSVRGNTTNVSGALTPIDGV